MKYKNTKISKFREGGLSKITENFKKLDPRKNEPEVKLANLASNSSANRKVVGPTSEDILLMKRKNEGEGIFSKEDYTFKEAFAKARQMGLKEFEYGKGNRIAVVLADDIAKASAMPQPNTPSSRGQSQQSQQRAETVATMPEIIPGQPGQPGQPAHPSQISQGALPPTNSTPEERQQSWGKDYGEYTPRDMGNISQLSIEKAHKMEGQAAIDNLLYKIGWKSDNPAHGGRGRTKLLVDRVIEPTLAGAMVGGNLGSVTYKAAPRMIGQGSGRGALSQAKDFGQRLLNPGRGATKALPAPAPKPIVTPYRPPMGPHGQFRLFQPGGVLGRRDQLLINPRYGDAQLFGTGKGNTVDLGDGTSVNRYTNMRPFGGFKDITTLSGDPEQGIPGAIRTITGRVDAGGAIQKPDTTITSTRFGEYLKNKPTGFFKKKKRAQFDSEAARFNRADSIAAGRYQQGGSLPSGEKPIPEALIADFVVRFLVASGFTEDQILDSSGQGFSAEAQKAALPVLEQIGDDTEFWGTYEQDPDGVVGQLVSSEEKAIMAKKGAKLALLKKGGKKKMINKPKTCACGCAMTSVKEAGGKITSKCSCGCK